MISKAFVQFVFSLASVPLALAASPLKVVTTLPDLAEVVREVGGAEVAVESLLRGTEDAHFTDAKPSFIVKVAGADIFCQVGLGLEVGWVPKVLSKSANAKVQSGGPGYCEAGKSVRVIDVAHGPVDRSMGDVHPQGNPHFYLAPGALAEASVEIQRVLTAQRPERAAIFAENQKRFVSRMTSLKVEIARKLAGLSGAAFAEYHKDFGYFFKAYNLNSIGSIEEKPGVLPSAARLASVATEARTRQVRAALGTNHSPERQMKKFGELSSIRVLIVPGGVLTANERFDSIEKVQHAIADAILSVKAP
ncbi:MAG TPA: metal ABC transporter substrate-binding protein [Bdellovibrionota bacterium]|nr:metal ABC transporter substrate-binding protein [Bdellovibrionota bacterium]